MPRKIRVLWIFCCVIVVFGFLGLSMSKKMNEARQHEEQRASRPQADPQAQNAPQASQAIKADPVREIKELNALGKHQEATELARKWIDKYPLNAQLHTWWGISLVKSGQKSSAIEKFVRASQLDATNPKTFLYWGLTLAMENRFEDAIPQYEKAVELDPENSNALAYWGASLGQLGKHEEAVEKLEKSLNLNQFNPVAFGVLIDSLYHLEKFDRAWEAVARAEKGKVDVPEDTLHRLQSKSARP